MVSKSVRLCGQMESEQIRKRHSFLWAAIVVPHHWVTVDKETLGKTSLGGAFLFLLKNSFL